MGAPTAIELLEDLIADLEGKLNLAPGANPLINNNKGKENNKHQNNKKPNDNTNNKKDKKQQKQKKPKPAAAAPTIIDPNLPDICKLEFKVGKITKVWVHPTADKLYCEEIDVGEEEPRQIASGLRKHYTEEEMLGRRVLVVANLKAKKLVGFKSHGMVLCATAQKTNPDDETTETVEFVEPPESTPLGEIVTFDGLPPPAPFTPAQVEKKKVFQACMDGMKTDGDCVGMWNGHVFRTTMGVCKGRIVKGGDMR
mmetsp:Transcript_6171/g.11992  ORF Transcript_6171/g.11992 Transcript_6171/m.11992 type:complete len:254 (-) Transcript_6171:176-937(-)|eukprot:CAMPEP_0196155066 /NCGR_PEP_ID=MMETSP0910-20130528/39999_1 /TAXON_ID=49265 /ORGANISM="Thalassiosira rotula, Strain GSO102" /LENGTH=253 /DNA_ID=CAMNT_0041419209 /DNA_START=20 /DNA_END=781 /DNA_ORIENTATION=+